MENERLDVVEFQSRDGAWAWVILPLSDLIQLVIKFRQVSHN